MAPFDILRQLFPNALRPTPPGRTADELASTIRDFTLRAQTEVTDGSPQGRRALGNRRGRLLESGSTNSLAELGFVSRPFAGRHFE